MRTLYEIFKVLKIQKTIVSGNYLRKYGMYHSPMRLKQIQTFNISICLF
jgi:hypothetical protein